MCGTGDISADVFLGRARWLFQPGLVQQIDSRPGLRDPGRVETWPGDSAQSSGPECQPGGSQVYLTFSASSQ